MSHYGIILPQFWRGQTGRDIRTTGGKDAQLAALYLMSCENATMIGLYPLPLKVIKSDTGIGLKGLVRAFRVLKEVAYADYDARTEHVWVREMAKFRLGLEQSPLKPADNRVLGAQRLYDKLLDNPFLEPFFDRYAKELHLKGKRRCARRVEPLLDVVDQKPLRKGLIAPLEASNRSEISTEIRDQVQGSGTGDQDQGIRDQVQGSGKAPAHSRRPVENSKMQTGTRTHASTGDSDVRPGVQDRVGATNRRLCDRRRRVESQSPGAPRPIGFHGTDAGSSGQGPVGDGASSSEAARPAADATPVVELTGASFQRWPADAPGGAAAPGTPRGEGADCQAENDQRCERVGSEGDARPDTPVASGATAGAEPVDPNGEGLGETPGQAELRRTIERLRRGYSR